ncbi:hypothetical protein COP1_026842 [Malus domestica]
MSGTWCWRECCRYGGIKNWGFSAAEKDSTLAWPVRAWLQRTRLNKQAIKKGNDEDLEEIQDEREVKDRRDGRHSM